MSNREYPFKAWILGGTFIPKQIELTEKGGCSVDVWHGTEIGKFYKDAELFSTKDDAIQYGMRCLVEQEERIEKQKKGIEKKRANLGKAKARGES